MLYWLNVILSVDLWKKYPLNRFFNYIYVYIYIINWNCQFYSEFISASQFLKTHFNPAYDHQMITWKIHNKFLILVKNHSKDCQCSDQTGTILGEHNWALRHVVQLMKSFFIPSWDFSTRNSFRIDSSRNNIIGAFSVRVFNLSEAA